MPPHSRASKLSRSSAKRLFRTSSKRIGQPLLRQHIDEGRLRPRPRGDIGAQPGIAIGRVAIIIGRNQPPRPQVEHHAPGGNDERAAGAEHRPQIGDGVHLHGFEDVDLAAARRAAGAARYSCANPRFRRPAAAGPVPMSARMTLRTLNRSSFATNPGRIWSSRLSMRARTEPDRCSQSGIADHCLQWRRSWVGVD